MRYLRFLFEVRAWKLGLPVHTGLDDLPPSRTYPKRCWATKRQQPTATSTGLGAHSMSGSPCSPVA